MFVAHDYEKHYTVKEGDIVFDLGAYNGRHTILFSRAVGPDGLVVAVEPEFRNYAKLLWAIKEYRLENVLPINAVIVDTKGVTSLHLSDEYNGAAHSLSGSGEIQKALGLSLDDIFTMLQLRHIDFIKADIEGAELELAASTIALRCTRNAAIATYHCPDCATVVEDALLKAGMTIASQCGDFPYQPEVVTYGWRP